MPTDIKLDADHVTVDGHLVANILVKWESLPGGGLGGVFYLPPKDTETEVPLAVIVSRILSLVMDTRNRLPQTQPNWRWCKKCEGLFFAGRPTKGVCPAGGEHSVEGSGMYELIHTKGAVTASLDLQDSKAAPKAAVPKRPGG
jgi:hypothetical protein